MMKNLLDWTTKEVVSVYDELTLWSAPFGQMLLEHIPMKKGANIVDIGFGTGFPLIELSQRFGADATVYGIDIWEEGINRTKEKIKTFGIENIHIIEQSAAQIPIDSNSIDLVTSNLGINNFEYKKSVYSEIHRILRPSGSLCITTNPIGTFEELFDIMINVCGVMGLEKEEASFSSYVKNRSTKGKIVGEFTDSGFEVANSHQDTTKMRFVDAEAIFNHSLMRIAFRAYWEQMVEEVNRETFLNTVIQEIEKVIVDQGVFEMTIPMLYLEFRKK